MYPHRNSASAEALPAFEFGLLDQPVGHVRIAGVKQLAGDQQPLAQPRRRANRVVVMGEQQLGGRVVIVLLARPARLLEGEPRIRAKLGRHLRHQAAGIGRVGGEREARFRQGMIIGRNQRQHAARCIGVAVPQQPVEPLLVVFRAQRGGKPRQEVVLLGRRETALDPRRPQRRGAGPDLALVDHDFGRPRPARAADRGVALEPQGGGVVALARQRLLGTAAQRLLQRPIRILLDKAGNLGKTPVRAGAGIIQPADDFQRQRIRALAGLGIGLGPVAAARGGNRGQCGTVGAVIGARYRNKGGNTAEGDK